MGDVVTALARAVQDEGHRVSVILPKYDIINYAEVGRLLLTLPCSSAGLHACRASLLPCPASAHVQQWQ